LKTESKALQILWGYNQRRIKLCPGYRKGDIGNAQSSLPEVTQMMGFGLSFTPLFQQYLKDAAISHLHTWYRSVGLTQGPRMRSRWNLRHVSFLSGIRTPSDLLCIRESVETSLELNVIFKVIFLHHVFTQFWYRENCHFCRSLATKEFL
jgi:hypothetical protein